VREISSSHKNIGLSGMLSRSTIQAGRFEIGVDITAENDFGAFTRYDKITPSGVFGRKKYGKITQSIVGRSIENLASGDHAGAYAAARDISPRFTGRLYLDEAPEGALFDF
jgi:hypothetical protein